MIFFIQSRYQLLLLLFISFFLCLFFPSVFHFVLVLILVFVISFFVVLLSGGYENQRIHNTVEYNSKKKENKSEISVDFRTITQAARLLPSLACPHDLRSHLHDARGIYELCEPISGLRY